MHLSLALPVIDLPNLSTFAHAVADPRFPLAIGISILAGTVRGFSGFGSALIYVPLMSAVYDPRVAAASFVLIDCAVGASFVPGMWRKANWREILPLAAAAIVAAQFGTLILQYADPTLLRWAICGLVASVIVILASGWRYHGRPHLLATLAVGFVAGLLGGAVQISGPPVIVYWLGSAFPPDIVRANFIVYFAVFSLSGIVTYLIHGLITAPVIALALLIGPVQIFLMVVGTRLFHLATEKTYRRVAYVIVALSALVSMPLWDHFLR